jgi:hypothetical protein
MVARRQRDGGGASAQDGDRASAMRTKRRRVGGVGIFIGGRTTFYRVEAAGEAGCLQWLALKEFQCPRIEGIGYWRIEEGRGCRIMGN